MLGTLYIVGILAYVFCLILLSDTSPVCNNYEVECKSCHCRTHGPNIEYCQNHDKNPSALSGKQ